MTDADFDAVALAVRAALAALLARQAGVIVARLRAPKTRKHTRFWTPENEHDTRGGDADIDEDRVVSAARWEERRRPPSPRSAAGGHVAHAHPGFEVGPTRLQAQQTAAHGCGLRGSDGLDLRAARFCTW
ncbi:hypothetical protein ACFQ60_47240 [Streptomyces zhihengii]